MAFYALSREEQIRVLAWDRIVRAKKGGKKADDKQAADARKRARLDARLKALREGTA